MKSLKTAASVVFAWCVQASARRLSVEHAFGPAAEVSWALLQYFGQDSLILDCSSK